MRLATWTIPSGSPPCCLGSGTSAAGREGAGLAAGGVVDAAGFAASPAAKSVMPPQRSNMNAAIHDNFVERGNVMRKSPESLFLLVQLIGNPLEIFAHAALIPFGDGGIGLPAGAETAIGRGSAALARIADAAVALIAAALTMPAACAGFFAGSGQAA